MDEIKYFLTFVQNGVLAIKRQIFLVCVRVIPVQNDLCAWKNLGALAPSKCTKYMKEKGGSIGAMPPSSFAVFKLVEKWLWLSRSCTIPHSQPAALLMSRQKTQGTNLDQGIVHVPHISSSN